MATTPAADSSTTPTTAALLKSQPLWQFALIGLGPLTVLAAFGLALALFQRLA